MFTVPLIYEALESFQDNQTYIEDLKGYIGRPLEFTDALKANLGEDWQFWWVPTKPLLNLDYCERIYTLEEIYSRRFKSYKHYEYDPQSKLKAIEKAHVSSDRMKFLAFTAVFVASLYGISVCYVH
jgi:hypothetical protein